MHESVLNTLFYSIKLYNSELLHSMLEVEQWSLSDNELLCLAYEKWGEHLLSHLKGDFSFALYNPEKSSYFCARDPLGSKPFYFTKIKTGYCFASKIDDLLALPGVIKKPNLNSMRTMLYRRAVDHADTMYEGIHRLPPGHFMTIKDGKEQIRRYWYPEKIERDDTLTEEEAIEKLQILLLKVVKRRVPDLKETAFEVSGGLDSSSIVSLLSHHNDPSKIESYSMDFQGLKKCNEGTYVDSILEKYPLRHQKIPSANLDYKQTYTMENLYGISPNWPIVTTFAMVLPMFEKMKQDGKKIVITGQGGDHLFTGTPFMLHDLFRRFKFLTLYRELKTYSKPWETVKARVIKPFLGEKIIHLIKQFRGKQETNPFLINGDEMKYLIEGVGRKNPAYQGDLDMITSAAYNTVTDGSFFHCVEAYFGVEQRHPFFDLELVEFALSLPPEMKYKQRTIKWILRKAMDGILPDKIRDRKDKAEFSEVITQQIDAIDLGTLLDDPYIVKLGLIEQSLIDKHREEYGNKTTKYIIFLWTIINMEYWYRYNFEKESLAEST